MRLEAAAKGARLKTKMEFLNSENELRRLQTIREIAIADAEESALKNIFDEETGEFKIERETKFKMDPRPPRQFIEKDEPVKTPEVNLSDQNRSDALKELVNLHTKQAELSTLLVQQQRASQLPAKKPPVFTGDAFDYPAFTSAFDS